REKYILEQGDNDEKIDKRHGLPRKLMFWLLACATEHTCLCEVRISSAAPRGSDEGSSGDIEAQVLPDGLPPVRHDPGTFGELGKAANGLGHFADDCLGTPALHRGRPCACTEVLQRESVALAVHRHLLR